MSQEHRSKVLSTGRVEQKRRTRDQLLVSARDMLNAGRAITVSAVARNAGISVATAYRYFPDPETLKTEAVLASEADRAAQLNEFFHQKINLIDDIEDRVLGLNRLLLEAVLSDESAVRLQLSKRFEKTVDSCSADGDDVVSEIRKTLVRQALAPAEFTVREKLFDSTNAIVAATGAEPYLVLRDVAKLTPEKAIETMERNLRTLVRAYLGAR